MLNQTSIYKYFTARVIWFFQKKREKKIRVPIVQPRRKIYHKVAGSFIVKKKKKM